MSGPTAKRGLRTGFPGKKGKTAPQDKSPPEPCTAYPGEKDVTAFGENRGERERRVRAPSGNALSRRDGHLKERPTRTKRNTASRLDYADRRSMESPEHVIPSQSHDRKRPSAARPGGRMYATRGRDHGGNEAPDNTSRRRRRYGDVPACLSKRRRRDNDTPFTVTRMSRHSHGEYVLLPWALAG